MSANGGERLLARAMTVTKPGTPFYFYLSTFSQMPEESLPMLSWSSHQERYEGGVLETISTLFFYSLLKWKRRDPYSSLCDFSLFILPRPSCSLDVKLVLLPPQDLDDLINHFTEVKARKVHFYGKEHDPFNLLEFFFLPWCLIMIHACQITEGICGCAAPTSLCIGTLCSTLWWPQKCTNTLFYFVLTLSSTDRPHP